MDLFYRYWLCYTGTHCPQKLPQNVVPSGGYRELILFIRVIDTDKLQYKHYSTLICYADCPGWLWIDFSTIFWRNLAACYNGYTRCKSKSYHTLRCAFLFTIIGYIITGALFDWLIEDKDRRKVIYRCLSRAGSPAFNPILDLIDLMFSVLGGRFRRYFQGALLLTIDYSELWSRFRFNFTVLCRILWCDGAGTVSL